MHTFRYSNQIKQLKTFIFYCLLFISIDAIARAGGGGGNGGGGSHGGHGGGDGFGAIIYFIIFSLPFPLNIIVIVGIIILIYFFSKNQKQSSVYNNLVSIDKKYNTVEAIDQLVSDIPNFSQTEFYQKATNAFFKIQDAWQKQNLSEVRQFISDGIYQRFEAQFIMMRALEQYNSVGDIDVEDLRIVAVENDTNFHIIHLSITASMTDDFVSKKYSELNSGGYETFTEYWTFVKKINATKNTNLIDATNCPNCGDSIENKLGETSKCPSCGTQINNGDYDWILSEITQAEEFASNFNQLKNRTLFYKRLTEKGFSNSDFSPQYIEDKASNAYLQLKVAAALGDQKRIARFCSNTYTEKTKNQFVDTFLYNRLFIKDASLVNVYETETAILAALSITSVTQKVSVNNGQLKLINASAITTKDYLILSRAKKMTANKFSAMAHNCSNCGAPVEDSLQLTCKYCDAALNDNSKDWIVENLFSQNEYIDFKSQFEDAINSTKQEDKLEYTGLDPRDYALNNMMVVACADGIIQSKEKLFLINTAEEMGYHASKIKELFEQVKSSGLALKMPKGEKERAKILKLMHKIANIDGDFNDKEKAVLLEAEAMK
jgi:tellurite resistance protein/predicted Zn-ribbon and HTH transcriptional regulator